MSKANVPDAWDDDFEDRVDETPQTAEQILESMPAMSKAERRAKQAELNKRLWEEAEAPRANFYVDTRDNVPLQSDFKPSVKVLSRKPAPTIIAKKDPVSGIEKLTIQDDDGEDENSASKAPQLSFEERQRQAQKEREEKQRKYEEARERLFGPQSAGSGSQSPQTGSSSPSRGPHERSRGRGRGGNSRPNSAAGAKNRQLYDSNYSPKPDSAYVQKHHSPRSHSPSKIEDSSIVRQPRGPDGSGRGGMGFASRRGRKP